MHQDLNQKISQLLDDELDSQEAFLLLKKIQSAPELKDKLNRYEAISHALKSEVFLFPDRNFSTSIHNRIEQEPFHLSPHRKYSKRNRTLLATAASFALIAMIAGFNMNPGTEDVRMASAFQPATSSSAQSGVPARKNESDSVNKQINDYLQAHNSSVYTNGKANFQPYARVTAYSQK